MVRILTRKEKKIIEKKLSNKKLTQVESNRLSKAIRPKLKEISSIDASYLLNKLEYRQIAHSIENRIIKAIKKNLPEVDSIILYGSVVQNNYHDYNDIDIMIVTKIRIKPEIAKWRKIEELKNILKNNNIIADIEIISRENLIASYKNSPTLIYQLKDHKVIYGNIKIPEELEVYNIDLIMKLDWSRWIYRPTGREIYGALRNTILVRLLLNKIIDNRKLKESLYHELGKNLIDKLKNNKQSKEERKFALNYLKNLIQDTRDKIGGELWGKIEL
ncbi:MAG: nucleotidyltransferase domain-containing protein [Nanoarchaeota archaeon]